MNNENINLFLDYLKSKDYSQITITNYKSRLKIYEDSLNDIELLKKKLISVINPKTRQIHFCAIILYFRWLNNKYFVEELIYLKNPAKRVKKNKNINYTIKNEKIYELNLFLNKKEYQFVSKNAKNWNISKFDFIKLLIDKERRKEDCYSEFRIL